MDKKNPMQKAEIGSLIAKTIESGTPQVDFTSVSIGYAAHPKRIIAYDRNDNSVAIHFLDVNGPGRYYVNPRGGAVRMYWAGRLNLEVEGGVMDIESYVEGESANGTFDVELVDKGPRTRGSFEIRKT